MNRKIIAMALVLALFVSGCGAGGNGKRVNKDGLNPDYECIINVCGTWGNFEALDEASLEFKERYPNIEIVYNELEVFEEDLVNRMVSGKNLDIYMYDEYLSSKEDNTFLWENAQDLSGLDLSTVNPRLLEFGYMEDKQAAVPIFNLAYGFMVNEEMLAQYKLKVPENYEQLISCMETFKDNGIYPLLAPNPQIMCSNFLSQCYFDVESSGKQDDIAKELCDGVDSLGTIEKAIDRTNSMYENEYIHPDSYTVEDDYGATILRFFEGDIPFVAVHTDKFSGTKKREARSASYTAKPFKYCFIPAMGDEGYTCCYQQKNAIFMFVYDGVDEAKKPYVNAFLQYLISDSGSAVLSRVKNLPTANKNVGNKYFPYLDKLSDKQICYGGSRKSSVAGIDLHMFLNSVADAYEENASYEMVMDKAVKGLNK